MAGCKSRLPEEERQRLVHMLMDARRASVRLSRQVIRWPSKRHGRRSMQPK
jgi:hypothetical protein